MRRPNMKRTLCSGGKMYTKQCGGNESEEFMLSLTESAYRWTPHWLLDKKKLPKQTHTERPDSKFKAYYEPFLHSELWPTMIKRNTNRKYECETQKHQRDSHTDKVDHLQRDFLLQYTGHGTGESWKLSHLSRSQASDLLSHPPWSSEFSLQPQLW